ncbi:MAG: hypothetical protein ACXWN0_03175, partial [Isosphaeraceae bacterium]
VFGSFRVTEKRNPQGPPWGKRKAVFSVCRVKTVGSTEEAFPLLTLGLAGYGGESVRHQLKEDWRQTRTP